MSRRRRRDRPIFAARGPFAIECPGCRETVGTARDLVGRVAGCPLCRCAFVVPDPDAEAAVPRTDPDLVPSVGVPRPRRHADRREQPAAPDTPAAPRLARPAAEEGPAAAGSTVPAAAAGPTVAPGEPLVFSDPPPPSMRNRTDAGSASVPVAGAPAGGMSASPAAADDPAAETPAGRATAAHPVVQPASGQAADPVTEPVPADAGLAFHDPVKTVRSGGTEIELRRLTPEEKHARRSRRNLLILLVGAALLVALVVVLGTRGR